MTRNDFELFAREIKRMENRKNALTVARLCVHVFESVNPRFSKTRFFTACNETHQEWKESK